jgi:hypothetical protein
MTFAMVAMEINKILVLVYNINSWSARGITTLLVLKQFLSRKIWGYIKKS